MIKIIGYFVAVSLCFGYYSFYHERIFAPLLKKAQGSARNVVIFLSVMTGIMVPVTPILFFNLILREMNVTSVTWPINIFTHIGCYVLALLVAIQIKRRIDKP